MILEWMQAVPSIGMAAVWLFVPGLLVLMLIGLRGLALAALAPVVSVALSGVAAIALGVVGIPWAAWSYSGVVLLAAVLAAVIGRLARVPSGRRRSTTRRNDRRWWLPAGIAVGAIVAAWQMMTIVGAPDAISQTNDAVFHLNALRYAQETGSASSLSISQVIGASSFYPAAWHAVASLTSLGGVIPIPVAVNATTIVIAAGVWPLGIAWLTRQMSGSPVAAAFAGMLAGTMPAFPMLLLWWGVLYPNALSLALIPAATALVVALPGLTLRWRRGAWRWIITVVLVGIAFTGIALAQPSSLLFWILLVLVWVVSRAVRSRGATRRFAAIVAALLVVLLVALWVYFGRQTSGSHWDPNRRILPAAGEFATNTQGGMAAVWGLTALMYVGVIACCLRARTRWIVISWLGLGALYVLVAAFSAHFIRNGLLAPWYADQRRIVAMGPILAIPLAAIGLRAIGSALDKVWRSARPSTYSRGALIATALAACVGILWPAIVSPGFARQAPGGAKLYGVTEKSYLSTTEQHLLSRLPSLVPADAVVMGNPSTGSGYGYLFSGRDVVPKTWALPQDSQWRILSEHLRDAATDPAVCPALAATTKADYVLDFGPGAATSGKWLAPGMTNFAGQPGFELVSKSGSSSLWRITACD